MWRNEFTAIVGQDGPWYIAYCAEVPDANGQGKREKTIAFISEHRREKSLRSLPRTPAKPPSAAPRTRA
jgi:hypothetical protein